jgi:hypothetical protein
MPDFNVPVSPSLIQSLTAEITRLSEQQMDAMSRATFVGMTEEDELHEYDERRARITELVRELGVLTSRRAA